MNSRCSTQPLAVLSGKIAVSPGWKPVVYLVQPRHFTEIASNYGGIVVDSAVIDAEGFFAFSEIPARVEEGLFQVCIQPSGSRFPNQLIDDNPLISNYMPIVLQRNISVKITTEADRLQAGFTIENPTDENAALLKLRDLRHTSFRQHLSGHTEAPDENTLLEHEAALLHFREPLMAFADATQSLYAALVTIRWVSPDADYERVPEFLFRQCEKWRATLPDHPFVQEFCQFASPEKLPVRTGQKMPDFHLPLLSGDTVSLYQLLGTRLTVVDIWASWCAPCRRENREVLAPLYRQYREKGLQIIGYSIDADSTSWKNAISKDKAMWPHASHLTGDETPFLDALNIRTIPANFVLDAEGKVLGKNLHGEALRGLVEGALK